MSLYSSRSEILNRAGEYAARKTLFLRDRQLGAGVNGTVLEAVGQFLSGSVALKVFERFDAYERERNVYLRLQELSIENVCGHHVPQLLGLDDELRVIEITIVKPPFVLDFGGAYLDEPPDYPPEVLAEWETDKREQFEDRWPEVQDILSAFRGFGIHIADVNPGNIKFRD